MRPATACFACRMGKRKCRPNKIHTAAPCARCEKLRIHCSLSPATRAPTSPQDQQLSPVFQQHQSVSDGGLSGADDLSSNASHASRSGKHSLLQLDPSWRQEMVNHYFDVVHDKHHSLFHRPAFDSNLQNNQIPDVILCAVLSLGSRFSSTPQRHGDHFAERAYQALDMRDVSILTIQGCILLGTMCFVDGKSEAEALYYATALRLGLILDLPRRQCATELEHQINLRVWWTLYMIDIWSSAGLKLSRQLNYRHDVELPVEESQFLNLSTLDAFRTERTLPRGIWGEMARLTSIWAEIQDLNTTSVENCMAPMALMLEIEALAQKLNQWRVDLPPYLEETRENLHRYAQIGQGTSFAALHLGFHYYHEVLFYQFMAESYQNPSRVADSYANQCTYHAQAFCDLLYLAEQSANCKCLYAMVGHMLVVTSTVYMHMLFFGQETNGKTQAMRKRLEHNFEILTELQTHWVMLDTTLARLKVFHNACLYSIEHSFAMDRWMLRFILEHGTSMPEKFASLPDGSTEAMRPSGSLQDWYSETLS